MSCINIEANSSIRKLQTKHHIKYIIYQNTHAEYLDQADIGSFIVASVSVIPFESSFVDSVGLLFQVSSTTLALITPPLLLRDSPNLP